MFELDPTLAKDTIHLGDFKLSRLLWMNDRQYPWAILVPKVAGVTEIFQLSKLEQLELTRESNLLSETMSRIFGADKMNVAALGNVVSQLHIHHIARFRGDKSWPAPIWGVYPSIAYRDQELAEKTMSLIALLKASSEFEPAQ